MASDLTKEFRVQLIATMDLVLRNAVLDVLKLFENSIHEHEKELAQKGEKIIQLEGKLEEAEAKLKGFESRNDTGAKMTKPHMNASQREPEDVVVSHGQPSDDEADIDMPDDWRAPLGTETITKDDVCPSVRLRMLSIPLNDIAENHQVKVNEQKKAVKDANTGISLKIGNDHTQNKSTQMFGTASLCPPVANDTKSVLIELEQGKKITTGKGQEDPMTSKTEEEEHASSVSRFTEQNLEEYEDYQNEEDECEGDISEEEEDYSCSYCGKKFRTLFGQTVHERCHMSCRGCLTVFPSVDAVRSHEPHCPRLQKLMAKKSQTAVSSTPKSNEKTVNTEASEGITGTVLVEMTEDNCEDLTSAPQDTNQTVQIEEDTSTLLVEMTEDKSNQPHFTKPKKSLAKTMNQNTLGSASNSKPSAPKTTEEFPCFFCNRIFSIRSKWEDHVLVHTGVKPHSCNLCKKRFRTVKILNRHQVKHHQEQFSGPSGTIPLSETGMVEMTEDNGNCENLPSTSQQKTKTGRVKTAYLLTSLPLTVSYNAPKNWERLSKKCSEGLICILCGYLAKNKASCISHLRTHNKKRHHRCNNCGILFRYGSHLQTHKKNCRPLPVIVCDICKKRYLSQLAFDKHVCRLKAYTYFCGVCGARFQSNGPYQKHMEIHKFEGVDIHKYM
ncbi:uncharacterized protein V6R79_009189 [Siganus canaliculatus]